MARLHLVGFTTDLKNLVFATRKGAKSGTFLVSIDGRLRRTLEEVSRLEEESKHEQKASMEAEKKIPPSKLTPKEIQGLLRKGRSPQDIAKLAETDIAWIERFSPPILAEMAGVVDAVRRGTITKQRLGPSPMRIGEAIEANLVKRKVALDPEEFEDSWRARKRSGYWEVSFRYVSRGLKKTANFAYDPETQEVRPLNATATEIGWRPPGSSKRARPTPKKRK